MKKMFVLPVIAGLLCVPSVAPAQFATSAVSYSSGTGFAAGFTNAAAALGAPTPSATPFSPPFAKSQIVSVGTNGTLTLQFDPPVINNPSDPFGLDFLVFGNSFFVITNGNFSGGGITSGALGGNNTGSTRVEVSADGLNWFTLNPALAPAVDTTFPTDGSGDPHVPVDPSLAGSFGGLGLDGIRALYNGSAGGNGYDLSWAQDSNGAPVNLPIVRYVRLHVLTSRSEIDAVSLVRGGANVIADDFLNDPAQNGWRVYGDTNLFAWDAVNQNLSVTWDSSQPNSYFFHPLGTIVNRYDDFSIAFDLRLADITSGNEEGKTSPMAIGVGFLNFANATNATFARGLYGAAPSVAEWDYFPAGSYTFAGNTYPISPTLTPTFISTDGFIYSPSAFIPYEVEFPTGQTVHVSLAYTATNQTLVTTFTTNGVDCLDIPPVVLSNDFGPGDNFSVDTFSISSYGSAGDPYDSVLAHGVIDNVVITVPPSPILAMTGALTNASWQTAFVSRTNWVYTLQRTADFQAWTDVLTAPGTGATLSLQDTNPPADHASYRVKAERP